jgi:hypothetical protein
MWRLKISGWWYTYPSEKYEFVSWDNEIPTTNQILLTINHYYPSLTIIILYEPPTTNQIWLSEERNL